MSCKCLAFGLFVVVAAAGEAGAQGRAAAMRFKEMDRNGDGIVSQAEWRGSKRSFEVHDWNGDGRLSGDEVRVGGTRPRADQDPSFDSADREYSLCRLDRSRVQGARSQPRRPHHGG